MVCFLGTRLCLLVSRKSQKTTNLFCAGSLDGAPIITQSRRHKPCSKIEVSYSAHSQLAFDASLLFTDCSAIATATCELRAAALLLFEAITLILAGQWSGACSGAPGNTFCGLVLHTPPLHWTGPRQPGAHRFWGKGRAESVQGGNERQPHRDDRCTESPGTTALMAVRDGIYAVGPHPVRGGRISATAATVRWEGHPHTRHGAGTWTQGSTKNHTHNNRQCGIWLQDWRRIPLQAGRLGHTPFFLR